MPEYMLVGRDSLGNTENYVFLDAWDNDDARERTHEEIVQDGFWGCHFVKLYRLDYVDQFEL
jgi:hypothetical protein